ncbi:MAG: class I SAM-dependent methyltransferase [Frankiaceae bacterium]|nr:class I SAM-dependent methyltransferase [Frankiaceae bacterium]
MADERVSPTAHYTGYVWARAGLSDPAFVTNEGRLLHSTLAPLNLTSQLWRGPTLDGFLLARHRLIDQLLEQAVESGEISQVIEVAAGLSPRGWTFAKKYGDRITYVETDLPGMAARKRKVLAGLGSLSEHHQVVELDALADAGAGSLLELTGRLDAGRGTAIVTEGLVNYFDRDTVVAMWRRFATALGRFSTGRYLSDLHLHGDTNPTLTWVFTLGLSAFVRGRVHLHFENVDEATTALLDCGFGTAVLHLPTDFPKVIGNRRDPAAKMVRIVDACR